MFVGADGYFAILAVMRLCWIRGRLGGGKTLLAVAIMHELVRRKVIEGVVANIPHGIKLQPWRDPVQNIFADYSVMPGEESQAAGGMQLNRLLNGAGILFDEAWTMLDNRTSMSNNRAYGAFARKLESYWVFPSVIPLDKRVSYLSVERTNRMVFPFITPFVKFLRDVPLIGRLLGPVAWLGSEMWKYTWRLDMGYMADEGSFWLMYPERYFALYDTSYIPTTDAGISDIWERSIAQALALDVEEGSWYVDPAVKIDELNQNYAFGEGSRYASSEQERKYGGEDSSTFREYQAKVRDLASRVSSASGGGGGDED